MNIDDRVIVPSYRSWNDDGEPYMVTEEKHLTGKIGALQALSTRNTPIGEEPMPGTDYHAFVIMDHPIGLQDVIQCKESQLVKLED